MTRKEQDRIAHAIAVVRKYYNWHETVVNAVDLIASNIANMTEETTPHFDRTRFLADCQTKTTLPTR